MTKQEEKINKIDKILENFTDVEFKPEGLGTLEFSKEIFTKNFKKEKINFRIERVAIQIADKVTKCSEEIDSIRKALTTFIAQPYEARALDFYELDYDAMGVILELISAFQDTPFLFTEGARKPQKNVTA